MGEIVIQCTHMNWGAVEELHRWIQYKRVILRNTHTGEEKILFTGEEFTEEDFENRKRENEYYSQKDKGG